MNAPGMACLLRKHLQGILAAMPDERRVRHSISNQRRLKASHPEPGRETKTNPEVSELVVSSR
jgi:hypothetical protein